MANLKINGNLNVVGEISGGLQSIINTIYPIGIALEFAQDVNPNTLWPWQHWEEWGEGCVVIGAGTHSDGTTLKTFPLTGNGNTGGEYNHKLNVSEMPSHCHYIKSENYGDRHLGVGAGNDNPGFCRMILNLDGSSSIGARLQALPEGGSDSHNNIQPYVVAKRWQRTE